MRCCETGRTICLRAISQTLLCPGHNTLLLEAGSLPDLAARCAGQVLSLYTATVVQGVAGDSCNVPAESLVYVLGGDQHGEVCMIATSIQAQHWRAYASRP
jgi:hypothetical protein